MTDEQIQEWNTVLRQMREMKEAKNAEPSQQASGRDRLKLAAKVWLHPGRASAESADLEVSDKVHVKDAPTFGVILEVKGADALVGIWAVNQENVWTATEKTELYPLSVLEPVDDFPGTLSEVFSHFASAQLKHGRRGR